MNRLRSFCGMIALALMCLLATGSGAAPIREKEAMEALEGLSTHFASLPAASVDVTITYESSVTGKRYREQSDMKIAFRKPGRYFREVSQGGRVRESLISDGLKVWRYVADLDSYEESAAPPSYDALLKEDPMGDITMINDLLRADALERLSADFDKITLREKTGGEAARYDVVLEESADSKAEIWIERGANPLPRRVLLTRPQSKVSIELRFENWRLSDAVQEERFAFAPPTTAKKVDSIEKKVISAMDEAYNDAVAPAKAKAPDFRLDRLDGKGKEKLSAKTGKIIIVCFWASWAKPCEKSVAELAALQRKYAEKGVELCLIAYQEKDKVASAWLKDRKIEAGLSLIDRDGKVGKSFGVTGVPHTFVITKSSTIAATRAGYSPEWAAELESVVKALTEVK